MFVRKCPRCHEGDLFVKNNPYDLKFLGKMPSSCPVCGQSYSPEPGFYFGASYVSYALTIVIGVSVLVANYLLVKAPLEQLMYVIIGAIILLSPVVMVLSRSIWINFFVKYDEAISKSVGETDDRIST